MPHIARDREKLIHRVRRIRGQVDAIEKALLAETEGTDILQLVAACRGALNSLMAVLIEGQVRFHLLSPGDRRNSSRSRAADELLAAMKTYLR